MLPADAVATVNLLEDELEATELTVGGTMIWPLVRMAIGFGLTDPHTLSVPRGARRWRARADVAVAAVRGLRAGWPALAATRPSLEPTLLLLSAASVATDIAGRRLDRFAHPLRSTLPDARVATLTLQHGAAAPAEGTTPVQSLIDAVTIAQPITTRLRATSREADRYERFVQAVRAVRPDVPVPGLGAVTVSTRSVLALSTVFGRLLDRSGARAACVVGWHGAPGMAMSLACVRRGLRTIELQHGVEGEQNVGYGSWRRVPASGYELVPDTFWCWQEEDRQAIEAWASTTTRHRAIVGGNAFLRMWMRGEVTGALEADRAARAARQGHERVALLTLSPGDEQPAHLGQLREAIALSSRWHWWIRLHPAITHTLAPIADALAGAGSFEMEMPSRAPLYSVLGASDAHVTRASAAAIEAIELGVRSVVTSEQGAQYLRDLVRRGLATAAVDPHEIQEALEWASSRRTPAVPPDDIVTSAGRELLAALTSR